jgi:isopenicillin-N N-acyltransferase-like protein
MIVLSLHGDHYQMGRQHGQQVFDLRSHIIEAIDIRLNALDERCAAEEHTKLLGELERVWNEQARSTMAMLRGMADSLELPFARLFHYAAASYVEAVLFAESRSGEGCTAWAASGPNTRGGAPILAKNRDLYLRHQPLKALAYATPQKGYRYLYATSIGSPAVYSSGINETGLTIADTHVSSRDLGPGLARYTLMMDVLEQCSTVTAAINYLQRAQHMGGGNLIVADAMGDVAVFEAGYRQWGLIRPPTRLVVATNHFVSRAMRDYYVEDPGNTADAKSQARYLLVEALLKAEPGLIEVEKAKQIMSKHEDGSVAICRHRPGDDAGTISTAIYLPAKCKLFLCDGKPCEGTYVTYAL